MAKIIINEYLTLVCYLIAYQFPTPPCLSLSVLVSNAGTKFHRLIANKPQKFNSHSSGGWQVQDHGMAAFC